MTAGAPPISYAGAGGNGTREPRIPAAAVSAALGFAQIIGPWETLTMESETESLPFTGAVITRDTIGLQIVGNEILFPVQGVYAITFSFYPEYPERGEKRQILLANGSLGNNSAFLGIRLTKAQVKEQVTFLLPLITDPEHHADGRWLELIFEVENADPETPASIVPEELTIVRVA